MMLRSKNRIKQLLASLFKKLSTLFLVLIAITSLSCGQAPSNATDSDWLINALNLKEGSVVADIGAGDGDLTIKIARHVGPQGKVYSSELGSESVQQLRDAIKEANVSNVNIIEGHPDRTNLTEQCCDAIFMRRVYHHIKNPKNFNISLRQSLKEGGRLAIIDFVPSRSEAEPSGRASGSQHGVTADTVVEELEQAGLRLISSYTSSGGNIYVVMEKTTLD